MRKIAVALTKGGVGKTTSAVNLAAGLTVNGQRVLLIDADTQGQVSRALGIQPQASLGELAMGDASFEETIILARDNLWLISGGQSLSSLKMLISM
jgi:chromosome partitioning protein